MHRHVYLDLRSIRRHHRLTQKSWNVRTLRAEWKSESLYTLLTQSRTFWNGNDRHHDSYYRSFITLFSRYVRIIRIPIIAFGIYTLGYHQGVIESHRNPIYFKKQLLNSFLQNKPSIVLNENQVKKIRKGKLNSVSSIDLDMTLVHQIALVALSIIESSRQYIDINLKKAIDDVNNKFANHFPSDQNISEEEMKDFIHSEYLKDKNVQYWISAKERIRGKNDYEAVTKEFNHIYTFGGYIYDDIDNPFKVWNFVFIEDDTPNAFVSELLPNHIFIHTGLVSFTKNIDEIAFILGHEVSHLICGHSSRINNIEFVIKSVEILLLSIDPSLGFVTILIVALLATISEFIQNSFSKEYENEADKMAIILTSMSCYKPIEGSHFMYRMSTLENQTMNKLLTWMDTHPPSINRSKEIYKLCNDIVHQQQKERQQKQQIPGNHETLPLFPCSNTEICKAAQRSRILFERLPYNKRTVNLQKKSVDGNAQK